MLLQNAKQVIYSGCKQECEYSRLGSGSIRLRRLLATGPARVWHTISNRYPLHSSWPWLKAVHGFPRGGLPVSVPFPTVSVGLGPALSPGPFWRASHAGPLPAGGGTGELRVTCHAGSQGISGHRDALVRRWALALALMPSWPPPGGSGGRSFLPQQR